MGKHTLRNRGNSVSKNDVLRNRSIFHLLDSLFKSESPLSSIDVIFNSFNSSMPCDFEYKKDMCSLAILIMSTILYENTRLPPAEELSEIVRARVSRKKARYDAKAAAQGQAAGAQNIEIYINILKPLFMVKYGTLRRIYIDNIRRFFIDNEIMLREFNSESLINIMLHLIVYVGKDQFRRICSYIELGYGIIYLTKLQSIITKEMKEFASNFFRNDVGFRRKVSLAFGESCQSVMQVRVMRENITDRTYNDLILSINGEYTDRNSISISVKIIALQILFFKLSQVLLRSTGENKDDIYMRIFKNLLQPMFGNDIIAHILTGDEDFLRLDHRSPNELTDAIFQMGAHINFYRSKQNNFFKILDDINLCKEIEDPEGKLDISNITNFVQCFVTRHEKRFKREHGSNVVLSN